MTSSEQSSYCLSTVNDQRTSASGSSFVVVLLFYSTSVLLRLMLSILSPAPTAHQHLTYGVGPGRWRFTLQYSSQIDLNSE